MTPVVGRDTRVDVDGDVYEVVGDYGATLRWSEFPEGEQIVISGSGDVANLNRFKNILLALRNEFGSGPIEGPGHIVVSG